MQPLRDPFHLVVIDVIDNAGLDLLRDRADLRLTCLPEPTPATIAAALATADGMILRGRVLADAIWAETPALRLVSRHGVGCDNLDLPALEARGVTVAVTADANAISVAEHTFTLMLAASRRLVEDDRAVRSGNWTARERLAAMDLHGRCLALLGFGRIGREVAKRALAFGMRVVIHDPAVDGRTLPDGITAMPDAASAMAEADVVSVHVPLMPATRGLLGAELIGRMRPGTLLVNASRGGVVDEAAVCDALDRGQLAFYATDVFAQEPPAADDPLLGRSDVVVTPHVAAMTKQGARRMAEGAARNVLDFLDGRLDPSMIVVRGRA